MSVVVSKHANKRIKSRVHKSVQRAADEAFAKGVDHADLTGSLKRYVDGVAIKGRLVHKSKISAIKIYYANVYLFAGDVLVTVMHLPTRFAGLCKRLTDAKEKA
jgi:hypothetical protein